MCRNYVVVWLGSSNGRVPRYDIFRPIWFFMKRNIRYLSLLLLRSILSEANAIIWTTCWQSRLNNMRVSLLALLGFMPSTIMTQDIFETADFNVTEALLKNGVDMASLPELSKFETRSSSSSCSVAVSALSKHRDSCLCHGSAALSNLSSGTKKFRRKTRPPTMLLLVTSGQINSESPNHSVFSSQTKPSMYPPSYCYQD
jgi:hypothetical protein